ncbi:sugar ABC transporter permease [Devosia sp.]|uniref:carbohydrate ABC transporter permease n=1 Tax=Devosia sp. TaxID=1871048 RepID=UPI0032649CB7
MNPASKTYVGFLYVVPALLFVAVFVFYPLSQLIWISLTDASLLGGGKFVGWDNYAKAFSDKAFWQALGFTLKYTLWITPILIILGFALALLVVPNRPLPKLARTIVFLPVVIGLGSSSLLWVWLFDQQVGPLNRILMDLHVIAKPMAWFTKADTGYWAAIISVIWKVVGFGMILFVAAINSISHEVNEAAMIDGASYWQRVTRIILPLSWRTIVLATLISAIGSMLAFDQFYILTGGGPRGQTFTSVYWIYQNAFVYFKLGYGAALSLILAVIILIGAAVQIWMTRPRSPS